MIYLENLNKQLEKERFLNMIVALSYILAVIITFALAIILYPIAAIFWIFGLLGQCADGLFNFTKTTITKLWNDIRDLENKL